MQKSSAKAEAERAARELAEAEQEAKRLQRAAEEARLEANRQRAASDDAKREAERQKTAAETAARDRENRRREMEEQNARQRALQEAARVEADRQRRIEEEKFFVFSVCNRTSSRISVAVDYYSDDEGARVIQGWKIVDSGQCPQLGRYRRGDFNFFAKEYTGRKQWGGTVPLCVEFPGPFKRVRTGPSNCDDRSLKNFISKHVDSPSWTANINP